MLTKKDLLQITAKGMSVEDVNEQLERFKEGFPPLPVTKPAKINKGILRLTEDDIKKYLNIFETKKEAYKITKFTPASGAASRMFQHLYETMKSGSLNDKSKEFFLHIKKFAFYPKLSEIIDSAGKDIDELLTKQDFKTILEYLLTEKGMHMGNTPKALIPFHLYDKEVRTALEEHLVEAAHYATIKGKAGLHFTVSNEHKRQFMDLVKKVKSKYENRFGIQYDISYSEQNPNTDIIAANPDGTPFRTENGKLLFRPGGHGALLENMDQLDTDLTILKNIDNIIVDRDKEATYTYKKVLTGMAIEIAEKTADYVAKLKNETSDDTLEHIKQFVAGFMKLPGNFDTFSSEDKKTYLFNILHRPIRICGMVPSDEDTGGGPFWVKQEDGSEDIQIVETAQLDMDNPETLKKVKSATHFNPVDIVCYTKDHTGEPFDLMQFRDPETGFITKKSKDGKDLLAQELPGLWNGSMARWISVLIEVPPITFNPVKSVNDLLLPSHQG